MQPTVHAWFEPEMLVGVEAHGYQLERVVGSGGFGAVYLSESAQGDPRAVKVLYPPHSRDSEDQQSWANRAAHFLREVTIVARFRHKNIISTYDTGYLYWRFDDPLKDRQGRLDRSGEYLLPFYVTEYIPDGLDQHVQEDQLLDYESVVRIGEQICDGLAELHGADPRVLHRDLNPGNIRLAEGRRAVITDFGAAQTAESHEGRVTVEIVPPYVAAPEQLMGQEADERTDIYQVGALLFAMLTGRFPRGADVSDVLSSKRVPKDLARAISRCLAIERKDRFRDVVSLRTALIRARLSSRWGPIMWLARLLGGRVYGWVVEQIAGRVPPVWRKPVFWLSVASLALIIWLFVWPPEPPTPPIPVQVTIASSSVKKEWINRAIQDFNEASGSDESHQLDGRQIVVEVRLEETELGVSEHYRSGTMIRDILDGSIKPTIASPAEWPGGDPIISGDAPDLMRTPLVIAMWRSRATAMGCWPTAGPGCTWQEFRDLGVSPVGWGKLGHVDWGGLKFGYGEPGKSNSGTFTQVVNCFSGLGKTGGMSLNEVSADTGCGQATLTLNRSEPLIRPRSDEVCQLMREVGSSFLDACISYEKEVIEVNRRYSLQIAEPIVAVYPQDGTIDSTHPFAILDGAPWVQPEQAEAAQVFLSFLLSDQQQSRLANFGFRPTDPDAPLETPIDHLHGVDPNANIVLVEVPDPAVIDAVVELWACIRMGGCPG